MKHGIILCVALLTIVFGGNVFAQRYTTEHPDVLRAIDKGLAYLEKNGASESRTGGIALAALALVKNGAPEDHALVRQDGRILSRAIFGFMEGESRQEGRAVFSLFGVNTPFDLQRCGYAGMNLSNLMAYVKKLGGDVLELHVYADNPPALRLYESLGFRPLAETMMMHRR